MDSSSLATLLGTQLGLTQNPRTKTTMDNLKTTITLNTTIPQHPKHPYVLLKFQNANMELNFHAQPSSQRITNIESVPRIQHGQVSQTPQVNLNGKVNTIIQGKALTSKG